MECFKDHGFEKEGFNCGFTLPFNPPSDFLPFNPPRGWRASPPDGVAGKPAFDKSSDYTCATPDKSAGKFWFGRPAFAAASAE
jgi:hypothetical protein